MDEEKGEMTTIAISDENSQPLIDAFNTGDFTIFTTALEKSILSDPIEVFESFLDHFVKIGVELKLNDTNLLHILVKLLPDSPDYEKTSEYFKRAVDYGIDINEPDEKNKTTFFYLLQFQPKFPNNKLFDYIFDNFSVDFHNFRGDKMQQMLDKQNPGRKVPEKIEASSSYGYLTSKLNSSDYSEFLSNFKAFKAKNNEKTSQNGVLIVLNENNNEKDVRKISEMSTSFQDKCSHFLYKAVVRGAHEVVDLLVAEGIDVNRVPKSFKNKRSPAFLAASYGHYKVLESLMKGNLNLTHHPVDGNILHLILHASYTSNITKDPRVDHQKCFELVVSRCDINEVDENGQTTLHHAVHHRNNEAILELLRKGANVTVKNNLGETPMDEMGKEVFEEFLDERINLIQTPEDKDQKEITIGVDLKFLANNSSEVEALRLISQNRELRPLIQHPTIASFVFLKWNRYSFIFYSNFVIFTLLISALIGYLGLCHMGIEDGRTLLRFFSLLAISLLIVRETFQCVLSCMSGINYFKSLVNIFEIILIVLAVMTQLPDDTFTADNWKILRALTILFSAFEILHLFGDLPFLTFSTHMAIFTKVGWNYLKCMLLYIILIIAFALAFFVLYGGEVEQKEPEEEFNNFALPPVALLKVIVMGIGEFDASNLSLTSKSWFYWLIFVAFVFLIPVVLFNVLCALAVDDIQKIKAQGELTDLLARIKVLNRYEKMINSDVLNFLPCWRKLRRFVTLSLPDGRIVVAPHKRFAILKSEKGKSEVGGCFGSSDQKCWTSCSRLDYKIGKKLRIVIENRKERKMREEKENELKVELEGVRGEMNEIKNYLREMIGRMK